MNEPTRIFEVSTALNGTYMVVDRLEPDWDLAVKYWGLIDIDVARNKAAELNRYSAY